MIPSFQELLIILLIILVIFGATKLPQLGRGLGEGIRNFKHGLKGDDEPSDEKPPQAAPDDRDS